MATDWSQTRQHPHGPNVSAFRVLHSLLAQPERWLLDETTIRGAPLHLTWYGTTTDPRPSYRVSLITHLPVDTAARRDTHNLCATTDTKTPSHILSKLFPDNRQ